jgi:tRNA A-37 threonylcarbamoyl transferase component Bud32
MDSLDNSTVVAGYRIDGRLGEGGMGTVYRATQLSLERVVALKVLTTQLSSDPMFRERFRREGLLQAALDHPHIVTVYEAGETEDRLFLAMRMVEGPTLKQLILGRSLGDRRGLRLLTQVAEALDAAHVKGLIHRDVKPQNVLIGSGDYAYLADFGLTRAHDDTPMTDTGLFVGTIDYISPEQARGEHATAQSDVYALTAVLFECLTGQVPYVRASEERVLMAHLTEDPPRPSEVRADLPEALDEVIAQGMAKDPAQRPASASELMLNVRRAFGTLASDPAAGAPTQLAATAQAGQDSGGDPGATRMAGAVAVPPLGPTTVSTPPTSARGERAGGWFVPAVVVAALIAAVVGVLAGAGGGGTSRPFSDSASATDIELSFPSSWKRVSSPPAVPGFDASQSIVLQRPGELLTAGEVNASGPSLLSSALLAGLPSGPPSPSAVRLGGVDAYRYSDLSVHGLAGALTLYAVPSSGGVVTIACVAQSTATSAAAGECAQIAATLRLNSVSAFALTPSPQYASALSATLASLQSSLVKASGRLHGASSAAAQAAASSALAHAFHSAGSSVSRLSVSPAVRGINADLASGLQAAGGDYDALSSAASAEDQGAYSKATQSLSGSYAKITGALAQLRKAGYSIGG